MKFIWSTLKIINMEESLKFYEEVIGLKVDSRFKPNEKLEIAFLGDGETKVELICAKGSSDLSIGSDISWGFQVDSLAEFTNFLVAKNIEIIEGPIQPNPFTKFIYIKDPNGLKIQVVEKR